MRFSRELIQYLISSKKDKQTDIPNRYLNSINQFQIFDLDKLDCKKNQCINSTTKINKLKTAKNHVSSNLITGSRYIDEYGVININKSDYIKKNWFNSVILGFKSMLIKYNLTNYDFTKNETFLSMTFGLTIFRFHKQCVIYISIKYKTSYIPLSELINKLI